MCNVFIVLPIPKIDKGFCLFDGFLIIIHGSSPLFQDIPYFSDDTDEMSVLAFSLDFRNAFDTIFCLIATTWLISVFVVVRDYSSKTGLPRCHPYLYNTNCCKRRSSSKFLCLGYTIFCCSFLDLFSTESVGRHSISQQDRGCSTGTYCIRSAS
jgi:hypothetical protein